MSQEGLTPIERVRQATDAEDTQTICHHPERANEPLAAIIYDILPDESGVTNIEKLGAFRNVAEFDRFIEAHAEQIGGTVDCCTIVLSDGSVKEFKRIPAGNFFSEEGTPNVPQPVAVFKCDEETGYPIAQEAHVSAEDFLELYRETEALISTGSILSVDEASAIQQIPSVSELQGNRSEEAIRVLEGLGFVLVPLDKFVEA